MYVNEPLLSLHSRWAIFQAQKVIAFSQMDVNLSGFSAFIHSPLEILPLLTNYSLLLGRRRKKKGIAVCKNPSLIYSAILVLIAPRAQTQPIL